MAFLTIGGITVATAAREDNVALRHEDVGLDFERAFDGTGRAVLMGSAKRTIPVESVPLEPAAAAALKAVLQGTPPVACGGDWPGVLNCFVTGLEERPVVTATGTRRVLSFTLHEQ